MNNQENKWNEKGGAALYAQIRSPKFSLVYPDLVKRLSRQGAKSLLDYGCGSGSFLTEFASELAIDQTGYDINAEMCALASKTCLNTPRTKIINDLSTVASGSFDAITQTALWMVLRTQEDCLAVLKTSHRLLSPNGKLYAAITHPCFRDRAFAGNILHLDMNMYLEGGTSYVAEIVDQDKKMSLTNYHWPLSALSQQLKTADFLIDEIYEYPDIAQPAQGSPWMLIVAQKR